MKFLYKDTSQINNDQVREFFPLLQSYTDLLKEVSNSVSYEKPESSLHLPSDKGLIDNVTEMKNKKVTSQLKYIIVIGIGGSNLGTKAVYDALFGHYDILEPKRYPKMIFLDTTEDTFISQLSSLMNTLEDKEEFILNAISKSGGTTETIANLEVILQALENKFNDVKDRLVITTDENSKMWERAKELSVDVLDIPKQVGGRFSVLSAVGLFPLMCCNINVESLRKGAEDMKNECLNSEVASNSAALSASLLYIHNRAGKNIHDLFLFLPNLESIGKWYRQLTGESLGKEKDLTGATVYAGITPTVSIGSTDLHSVGQLYLGGPRDKVTTFVYTDVEKSDIKVPTYLNFPLVEGIEGKSFFKIMKAIREGVKIAYQKQGLSYMEIVLDRVDEYSIGQLLQFKMIEMMYLGKLLNINTFDQPHVELYKTETKKILKS